MASIYLDYNASTLIDPASLAVIQLTKFVLAVNASTAEVLCLTLPPLWLTEADEIVE